MSEDKRKHLEMIQAVITRMAANSFILKGWSVTAGSGLIALAAGTSHQWVALVALLPSFVFWALDAYYLSLERRYRALFDAVARRSTAAAGATTEWSYSLDASPHASAHTWWSAARAVSVWTIPVAVLISVAGVYTAIASLPQRETEATRLRIQDTLSVRMVPGRTSPSFIPPKPSP